MPTEEVATFFSLFDFDFLTYWQRGIHDINRPFAFTTNPQFIFHDSPGFEAGDKTQLEQVQAFIAERARSTEVNDQLHAIWSIYFLALASMLTCWFRYCFEPNDVRPLLDSDKRFFEEGIAGNGYPIAPYSHWLLIYYSSPQFLLSQLPPSLMIWLCSSLQGKRDWRKVARMQVSCGMTNLTCLCGTPSFLQGSIYALKV